MIKYFKTIILVFAVLTTHATLGQDKSGSTEFSIKQCYEGENKEFALRCIPSCICVVADGCPCCDSFGGLLSILNLERQDQNEVVTKNISKLRSAESWQFEEQRKQVIHSRVPETYTEKAQYYTEMALLFLPDDQLRKIGVLREDETTGGVNIDIPFEYIAYSACWWGGVAGGGDVVDVGDDCKDEWLD